MPLTPNLSGLITVSILSMVISQIREMSGFTTYLR